MRVTELGGGWAVPLVIPVVVFLGAVVVENGPCGAVGDLFDAALTAARVLFVGGAVVGAGAGVTRAESSRTQPGGEDRVARTVRRFVLRVSGVAVLSAVAMFAAIVVARRTGVVPFTCIT